MRRSTWPAAAVLCVFLLVIGISFTSQALAARPGRSLVADEGQAGKVDASEVADEPVPTPVPEPPKLDLPVKTLKQVTLLGDPAFRHGNDVTKVLFLPDKKNMLTTGNDGTCRLWDLATSKQIQCFRHRNGRVWDVLLLPGGEQIATSGEDDGVTIWDIKSGKRLRDLYHGKMTFRLALDSAGKRLAAGDNGNGVLVWELATDKKLSSFAMGSAYTVSFDRTDKNVLAGSDDTTIRLWNLGTREDKRLKDTDIKRDDSETDDIPEDPNNTGSIFTMAVSPDKSQALVCNSKRCPFLLEVQSGKTIWQASDVPNGCNNAAWSPDEKSLAIASDQALWLIKAEDGSKIWTVDLGGGDHYAVAFHPDGKEIYCSTRHVLCRYDAKDGKRLWPAKDAAMQCHPAAAAIALPGTDLILEAGSSAGIRVYDRKTGKVKERWLGEDDISNALLSADGKTLLAVADKTIYVLDPQTGKTMAQWHNEGGYANCWALSADGKLAIGRMSYEYAGVWRTSDGQLLHQISPKGDNEETVSITGLDLSAEGQLAMAGANKTVRLAQAPGGTLIQDLSIGQDIEGCRFLAGAEGGLVVWAQHELRLWTLPAAKAKSLSDDEVKKLIEQLGSEKFKDREAATEKLIEAGKSILPILKANKTDDAERQHRIELVTEGVVKAEQYTESDKLSMNLKDDTCFALHPDGHHWAVASGYWAKRQLIVGDIVDGKLKALFTAQTLEPPNRICFDGAGNLIVANDNGTVAIYEMPKFSELTPTTTSAPATGPAGK